MEYNRNRTAVLSITPALRPQSGTSQFHLLFSRCLLYPALPLYGFRPDALETAGFCRRCLCLVSNSWYPNRPFTPVGSVPASNCRVFLHSLLFGWDHYLVPKNSIWRLILSYECPVLAQLVFCQLFLTYPAYLLHLGFYPFYFCMPFLYVLLCIWLCD